MKHGEPFNRFHGEGGFFPQDVVGRQRAIDGRRVTASVKLTHERLVVFQLNEPSCRETS